MPPRRPDGSRFLFSATGRETRRIDWTVGHGRQYILSRDTGSTDRRTQQHRVDGRGIGLGMIKIMEVCRTRWDDY